MKATIILCLFSLILGLKVSYITADFLDVPVIISPIISPNDHISFLSDKLFVPSDKSLVFIESHDNNRIRISSKGKNLCWNSTTLEAMKCHVNGGIGGTLWRVMKIDDNNTYTIFIKSATSEEFKDAYCLTYDATDKASLKPCDLNNKAQRYIICKTLNGMVVKITDSKTGNPLIIKPITDSSIKKICENEFNKLKKNNNKNNKKKKKKEKKCCEDRLIRDIKITSQPFTSFPPEIANTYKDLKKIFNKKPKNTMTIPKAIDIKYLEELNNRLAEEVCLNKNAIIEEPSKCIDVIQIDNCDNKKNVKKTKKKKIKKLVKKIICRFKRLYKRNRKVSDDCI